mmetsp:Transcript_10301/g.18948  ORF Transcript_10301/g.18948 Transcript_10301/m.18948 type:complete len:195 (-) Transcript_10301:18-602(-)
MLDKKKRAGVKKVFRGDKATPAKTRAAAIPRTKPDPKKGYAVVKPQALDVVRVKAFYGGKFPTVNGGKHTYPSPSDEKRWLVLIAEAMTYRNKKRHHARKGIKFKPDPRSSQFEYVLYHGRPDQIKRRAKRNRDRRLMLANGLGRSHHEIHHLDGPRLQKPIALTHCEHKRMHGQKCTDTTSPAAIARKERNKK